MPKNDFLGIEIVSKPTVENVPRTRDIHWGMAQGGIGWGLGGAGVLLRIFWYGESCLCTLRTVTCSAISAH